jgi:heterotetrameric sarcosine oxidase gamma subunit
MATTDRFALAPLAVDEDASLAALWPKSSAAIALQRVEPMHVLSLRHLPDGGTVALAAVMDRHTLPGLPRPGVSCGIEPRLIWRSPNEILLLTQDAALASALLAELRPSPGALACALDLSAGTLVVTLRGGKVEALLSRLVDAHALPRGTDQASRVRLADIAAVVWREAPDHVGLLVDRANGQYLARWLNHAAEAI